MTEKKFNKYTVTAALPYANGPVHIGHLAGVYVPADIYVRYLRGVGRDVAFIGGSDEHGVAITLKARTEGNEYCIQSGALFPSGAILSKLGEKEGYKLTIIRN